MPSPKTNGWIKYAALWVTLLSMLVGFVVQANVTAEKVSNLKEVHKTDIEYIRDDLKTLKEDVKKILEKL